MELQSNYYLNYPKINKNFHNSLEELINEQNSNPKKNIFYSYGITKPASNYESNNFRLIKGNNPKMNLEPIIPVPISELNYWKQNNFTTHSNVNSQIQENYDNSGYRRQPFLNKNNYFIPEVDDTRYLEIPLLTQKIQGNVYSTNYPRPINSNLGISFPYHQGSVIEGKNNLQGKTNFIEMKPFNKYQKYLERESNNFLEHPQLNFRKPIPETQNPELEKELKKTQKLFSYLENNSQIPNSRFPENNSQIPNSRFPENNSQIPNSRFPENNSQIPNSRFPENNSFERNYYPNPSDKEILPPEIDPIAEEKYFFLQSEEEKRENDVRKENENFLFSNNLYTNYDIYPEHLNFNSNLFPMCEIERTNIDNTTGNSKDINYRNFLNYENDLNSVDLPSVNYKANYNFIQNTNNFRNQIMESLMRKRNAEMYQLNVAPKHNRVTGK